MRPGKNVWMLGVGFLLLLGSCDYPNHLSYRETQCANPWSADSNETIYKQNIQQYLTAHGVTAGNIEIHTSPDSAEVCLACMCSTGRRIEIWVADEDIKEANGLGFN
jgi:hypothetical protein